MFRYAGFNKLCIKSMDISWETLENIFFNRINLKKISVNGWINIYQQDEKCPDLCPGPDIQDLINYL